MGNSRIITQNEFNQMQSYKPLAQNRKEQYNIKKKLLDKIIKAYGEKYYRLANGTKETIDMMAWLASERGFVFAGDEYLAKRHNISDRTVRNVARTLRELGIIVSVYRASTKHNGRGKPIHIFVDHEYFTYWVSFLQLDSYTNFQADFQAENNETPCNTKNNSDKKVSTYNSPILNKKHINTYNNKGNSFNFVTKEFKQLFNKILSKFQRGNIGMIYSKIILFCKKHDVRFQDYKKFFEKCIQDFIQAYKKRKTTLNNAGYFYGLMSRKIAQGEFKSDYDLFLEHYEEERKKEIYEIRRKNLLKYADCFGFHENEIIKDSLS